MNVIYITQIHEATYGTVKARHHFPMRVIPPNTNNNMLLFFFAEHGKPCFVVFSILSMYTHKCKSLSPQTCHTAFTWEPLTLMCPHGLPR